MASTGVAARIFQSPRLQSFAPHQPRAERASVCFHFVNEVSRGVRGRRLFYQNLMLYRDRNEVSGAIQAASPGLQKVGCSTLLDGVNVTVETNESKELKMRVHVSGTRTRVIFDDVFTKLVDAAQPIPGFRRIKGGKTPDIPKEILLHILGPSKVKKQSIKKIINSTVSEYVEKEGLSVSNDLRVEESYEDLEASFEPGDDFSFKAVIKLKETDVKT